MDSHLGPHLGFHWDFHVASWHVLCYWQSFLCSSAKMSWKNGAALFAKETVWTETNRRQHYATLGHNEHETQIQKPNLKWTCLTAWKYKWNNENQRTVDRKWKWQTTWKCTCIKERKLKPKWKRTWKNHENQKPNEQMTGKIWKFIGGNTGLVQNLEKRKFHR